MMLSFHFDERSDQEGILGMVPQGGDGRPVGDEESVGADIYHDPWLVPSSPSLKTFAAAIFEQIEDNSPRPARQRADARERRRSIVENLVASLALLTRHHPRGTRMAVSAKNDAITRYDRPQFPREVVIKIMAEMESLGLLLRRRGTRRQHRTTLEPTPRFRAMLPPEDGPEIAHMEGAETVILKANIGRRRPKVLVDYADTPETIAMREEMATINAALRQADLRLGSKARPPGLLTRYFQIEGVDQHPTFDRHGRLYGGFWINLPKDQRYLLRLQGEPVVDLDFQGMFPQLAYLEAGFGLPSSDPYQDVDGLSRTAVKLGLSALLCRSTPMVRLPSELRGIVPPDWNAGRLVAAIEERHPLIAPLFCSGVGLRLMFTESRILVEALLSLIKQGVVALPVHDGLMVAAPHEGLARSTMARASRKIVGSALPVVRKDIVIPAGVLT